MKHCLRSLLVAALFITGASVVQAQVTDSVVINPNYKPVMPEYRGVVGDSAVIPKSRQTQQKNYLEGTYPYPPKPRNKWEIGLHGGLFALSSDNTSRGGWGAGLQMRKAIGYAFSFQGHYFHGTTYGQNWQSNSGLKNNPVLNGALDPQLNYVDSGGGKFFYNNKTTADEITLNILLALNNLGFHKKATQRKVTMYAGVGAGVLAYRTWYNAKNGDSLYNYQGIFDSGDYTDRKKTYTALKALMDDSYETKAEGHQDQPALGNRTIKPVVTGTLGFSFHLTKNLNLNVTERITITHDDLLDGNRWQEHPFNDPALTRDFDTYHYVSLGLGYFFGSKNSVEPLYWQNPMDYTYDALNTLMKKNVDELIDTDDDGVIDKLDKEPATAQGAMVDTHGVTLDSDKDGVPDYKDKEPFTVPGAVVDSVGVGLVTTVGGTSLCNLATMPSVHFELDKYFIQPEFYSHLHSIAMAMLECPDKKVAAVGFADVRSNDAYNDLLSWERVDACIDYLETNYKIDRSRFLVSYRGEKDPKFTGLPASGINPRYESRQYVNRRVEFRWAGENETGVANPPRPTTPSKAGKEY